MMSNDWVHALAIAVVLQGWSWYVIGTSICYLMEGELYSELRGSKLIPGAQRPVRRFWRRLNTNFAGLVFGLAGIHLAVAASHPRNFYKAAGLPFVGVLINIVCLAWVCWAALSPTVPVPVTSRHLKFVRYCVTQSLWRRVVVFSIGVLVTFVGWLKPWCCVAPE
jgi:hypothetical protein